jgi:SAM-dependent methyltransferase
VSPRGVPAPRTYVPAVYWEDRARRFAGEGAGLAAVCSYGMPHFYNTMIHAAQRLALAPWLRIARGTRVLDVGCGVGRWSRLLARRGARVTGIDLSPTMVEESRRRAQAAGLAHACRFLVQDSTALELEERFDLILSVTVLQHILDVDALRRAMQALVAHLAPGGRIVLLEAAPARPASHCDSSIFRARPRAEYEQLLRECGLTVRAMSGVDPAPFKTWLLPYLPRLPRWLAVAALAMATAASAPIDAAFGRRALRRSWHAVFVLERAAPIPCGA